ncbi:helix-turn-helix domain-containing protein [Flavobacterium sp. JP2137]|uniref:helix-turn-helix domain-containing protein n=1 Tax=Flavobacterium sp. JP2137 TaxID=3414510 RepID=UPI003D300C01
MILPLHVLPFVLCSASLFVEAIRWEPTAIFMINLISLCGYGMYLSLLNRGQRDADYREWLVSSKFFLTILAAIQLLAIVDHIADLPFSFSPDIAIVVLLFTAMTFLVKTLVSERESPGEVAESDARELAVQRECPEADRCLISRIENYFDNNLAYLEPSFDLQTLADEIDVPKAHISSVINKEMNKNFYVLLAEYRIEHAKSLLIKQDYLFTIESVIYECGFNSKSSFHKHFKQLVGSTPSNYRDDYFSQHRREKA